MGEVVGEELSGRNFVVGTHQAPRFGSYSFGERSHKAKMGQMSGCRGGPGVQERRPESWSDQFGRTWHSQVFGERSPRGRLTQPQHAHSCSGETPQQGTLKAGYWRAWKIGSGDSQVHGTALLGTQSPIPEVGLELGSEAGRAGLLPLMGSHPEPLAHEV